MTGLFKWSDVQVDLTPLEKDILTCLPIDKANIIGPSARELAHDIRTAPLYGAELPKPPKSSAVIRENLKGLRKKLGKVFFDGALVTQHANTSIERLRYKLSREVFEWVAERSKGW